MRHVKRAATRSCQDLAIMESKFLLLDEDFPRITIKVLRFVIESLGGVGYAHVFS